MTPNYNPGKIYPNPDYVAAGTQPVQVRPPSVVQQQFEALEKGIDVLESRVEQLGERLAPVRRPAPGQPCGEAKPEEPLCQIAEYIRNLKNRVQATIARIDELESELEI